MVAERSVPLGKFVTWGLWSMVGTLLLSALVTWLAGTETVWELLGFFGCATSAAAATAHIRCYAVRICGVLRVIGGMEVGMDSRGGSSLRSIRE